MSRKAPICLLCFIELWQQPLQVAVDTALQNRVAFYGSILKQLIENNRRVFPVFRQLNLTMLVLFAILTLGSAVAFGSDDTSKTYRYTAKDEVDVLDDGTISKPVVRAFLKKYDKMVIDLGTGHVTYPLTGIREDRVVQQSGALVDEYVLVPSFIFQRKKTVANAAIDFIRIRMATASQPQTIFMAFSLSILLAAPAKSYGDGNRQNFQPCQTA
jgi:hypothetical protein